MKSKDNYFREWGRFGTDTTFQNDHPGMLNIKDSLLSFARYLTRDKSEDSIKELAIMVVKIDSYCDKAELNELIIGDTITLDIEGSNNYMSLVKIKKEEYLTEEEYQEILVSSGI